MKYLIFYWIIIVNFFACYDYSIKSCDYTLSIPVTISPAQDTFHTGDTINVEFKFPLQMTNLVDSSIVVDMSDFPFQFEAYDTWLQNNPVDPATSDFEYIPIIGDIELYEHSDGLLVVPQLKPKIENDSAFLSYKIVLDSIGIASIGIGNLEPLSGYNSFLKLDCRPGDFNLFFTTNGGKDNNYELLQLSPDPRVQAISKDVFLNSGAYVFVIVDK